MKKTIAIMQPYAFPYIGYFQLINLADVFVVHDDVQWIKGGWINRNRILASGKPVYITFPVEKGGAGDLIKDKRFAGEIGKAKQKLLRQIRESYRKSVEFERVMPVVERCLVCEHEGVSDFVTNSLMEWCRFLGIDTPFVFTSSFELPSTLRGEERVLEINRLLGADRYINPIGGVTLYHKDTFKERGIELRFLQAKPVPYPQILTGDFVPFLSIIDVAMNNPLEKVREMLEDYDLIEGTDGNGTVVEADSGLGSRQEAQNSGFQHPSDI